MFLRKFPDINFILEFDFKHLRCFHFCASNFNICYWWSVINVKSFCKFSHPFYSPISISIGWGAFSLQWKLYIQNLAMYSQQSRHSPPTSQRTFFLDKARTSSRGSHEEGTQSMSWVMKWRVIFSQNRQKLTSATPHFHLILLFIFFRKWTKALILGSASQSKSGFRSPPSFTKEFPVGHSSESKMRPKCQRKMEWTRSTTSFPDCF